MKRIGVNVRLEVIQKTALSGTAKILRKVLLKRLKNIRSLNGHYKDVEHENCAGHTDCCNIIRNCDEELGEVTGKLDTRISISLPPKNYSSRNRKDFKNSISQF